jgi:D-lactate dehydrogenase
MEFAIGRALVVILQLNGLGALMAKIAFFDTHPFERKTFDLANTDLGHSISYFETRLTSQTAELAEGHSVVCAFANDKLDAATLTVLKAVGVRLIALRSAGFNHVDLVAAGALGLPVVRVPKYSPYSVAEHAVCLVLALNRKIHRAYARVREMNFSLDGLVGFDLHGRTFGVIGTGKIGSVVARIMSGFGCSVLAYDLTPNEGLVSKYGVKYTTLSDLFAKSDIISLHVPLLPETKHLIDEEALSLMKAGVFLINTGRGALIDTKALIRHLKSGHIGAAGLDVYEEEENVFFKDLSDQILQDDQLARLLTFPNVLVTSHQGFLTRDALENIASTTLKNITDFEQGKPMLNGVLTDRLPNPPTD